MKLRICEILGVEVNEKFAIKFNDKRRAVEGYFLNEKGYLYNGCGQELNRHTIDLLNGKSKIVKLPKYTDEQKEVFKALKVLGFNWIAMDEDEDIFAYDVKPKKCTNNWYMDKCNDVELFVNKMLINFDFIKWEDEEPFEIPTLGGTNEDKKYQN